MSRKSRNTELKIGRSAPNSELATSESTSYRTPSLNPTTSSPPPLTTTLLPEVTSPTSSPKVDGESKEPVSVTQQSRPRKAVKEEDRREQTTEEREVGKGRKRKGQNGRKKRPQTGKKEEKRRQDSKVRL